MLDFLRDVGKHFTVNQMMAKDSVRSRIDSEYGISYTEFSYMLLQANDFRHLYEHHDVELQAGASDQWGNIVAGVELIRRKLGEPGICDDPSADDEGRRLEVRQVASAAPCGWIRRAHRRTSSASSGCNRRPDGGDLPEDAVACVRSTRSKISSPSTLLHRNAGRPSAPWPTR